MIKREILIVDSEEVELDPAYLNFNESTLSEYIKREGGWYDNFGAYLARAERALQHAETVYDNEYNLKFFSLKQDGNSDKMAEAGAKIDPDVRTAKQRVTDFKYTVTRLKNHLRAWDRNHDNAQSLGHTLRREMDRLNSDIRSNTYSPPNNSIYGKFDDVDQLVQHVDVDSPDLT
jgi:hypothetical protein